jgi:hypothetical protein
MTTPQDSPIQTALFFPQNNDVVVTAKFPGITDATGITAEFWCKTDRYTSDEDPASVMYSGTALQQGSDGLWYSQFSVPATDNQLPGAYWWRVDAIDADNHRSTANSGTLLVQAV